MKCVRVRGIYATALTNLLHQRGFPIVQPSPKIQTRFDFSPSFEPFDLELHDTEDRQGVLAVGSEETLEKVTAVMKENFPDVITRRPRAALNAIYLGLVRSSRPAGYLVDLGCDLGFLPYSKVPRPLRAGEAVLVQVNELAPAGKHLILTTEISLPGQKAVLSSSGSMGVSKSIEDPVERERLLNLGRRHLPNGWGVIWRTAACQCPERELLEALHQLVAQIERLQDHPEEGIPGLLLACEATAQFEFPGGSKARLDELRHEIIPTLPGHHKCKAAGYLCTADRAEARLQHFLHHAPRQFQENGLKFPEVGETLFIEHVKPDGEVFILGRGRVVASDPVKKTVQVRREMQGSGTYDGLKSPKAIGDYALSEFREGGWEYRTFYYSKDGRCKGIYANVNTPLEIYPDRVRYVDLEIDVTREPEGEVRMLDQAKLRAAQEAGQLSTQLIQGALQTAARLQAELCENPEVLG